MKQLTHNRWLQIFSAIVSILTLVFLLSDCGKLSQGGIESGDSQSKGTAIALSSVTPTQVLNPIAVPTTVSTNVTVTVVGSPTMHGTCNGTVIDIRNFSDGDHVRIEKDSCGNSQIVIPASIPDPCPKGASISYTPTGDSTKTGELPVAVYYGCKTEISG